MYTVVNNVHMHETYLEMATRNKAWTASYRLGLGFALYR